MVSFREHFYENWFMKEGVSTFEEVESVLSPLFSPKNEFILPLDWIWGEQEFDEKQRNGCGSGGRGQKKVSRLSE